MSLPHHVNPFSPAGLQKVDYTYNIRGWLKGINNVISLDQQGDPTDLFALKLNYNTVENSVEDAVRPLYNGNISETFWVSNGDNTKRKYGYVYDGLNRLKEAIYQKPDLGGPEQQVTNAYNEEIRYDMNGNIEGLERNGFSDADGNSPYHIDNLIYTYLPNSNRLDRVADATNSFNGLKNYRYLIEEQLHSVKHYGTNHIERKNLTLRTDLKRLNRRSICFSRSLIVLNAVLKLYFWS